MENEPNQLPQNDIPKPAWNYFLKRLKDEPRDIKFFYGENSKMSKAFYDIGKPELAQRWAYLFFKMFLDKFLNEKDKLNWSHTLPKAYWEMRDGNVDTIFARRLGELCGILYESAGRFQMAYSFYRESCPDKYSNKLNSVKLMDNGDGDWESDLPSDADMPEINYPDFHKANTKEENTLLKKTLLEEFLKSIPNEIMNIDIKTEHDLLLDEAEKIVANHK